MISVAFAAILSVIIVSLMSLVGLALLSLREKTLHAVILELIAFSIGALLGGVFLHLIPEMANELGLTATSGSVILLGLLSTFIMEKFIHWHHCHGEHCDHHIEEKHHIKPFAIINLLGDGIHNFIDGVIIAAAYLISLPLGFATTMAVVLHEIPQEIGDFAVLIHGGFTKGKALFVNFLTALTALVGALIMLLVSTSVQGIVPYLIPFAAGNFLYLAGTDLIPELHKETRTWRSIAQLLAILAGIGIMALLLLLE